VLIRNDSGVLQRVLVVVFLFAAVGFFTGAVVFLVGADLLAASFCLLVGFGSPQPGFTLVFFVATAVERTGALRAIGFFA
jgi:hypothetical protein